MPVKRQLGQLNRRKTFYAFATMLQLLIDSQGVFVFVSQRRIEEKTQKQASVIICSNDFKKCAVI